jgi:clan AA aspartic protease (TIGR02281 family)
MNFSRCTGYLFAGAILLTVFSVRADEAYLKSGGKIVGIITEEKNGGVTVDVGFGTTRIDSADIDSIRRSSESERNALRQKWGTGSDPLSGCTSPLLTPFIERIHRLRILRSGAVIRKRELENLREQIDSLDRLLENYNGSSLSLRRELETLPRKPVQEQFQIVGRAYLHNAAIDECQNSLRRKLDDYQKGNPLLPLYMDSLTRFSYGFDVFKRGREKKESAGDREVIDAIERERRQFDAEFDAAAIDVTFVQGNHIIIPVAINGRAVVNLILDTGASCIILSRALAHRLGIDWQSGIPRRMSLADGSVVDGNEVELASVTVKGFTATKVKAAILEKAPAPGIDGLLGMSYLDRFYVYIDPLNKKLVLKKFRAF